MNLNELPLEHSLLTDRSIAIKLVGIGGAGSNAVDRLKMENLERLQMAVINTDYQALSSSPVQDKVLIGMGVTRGLGAGGDPDLGREAAEAAAETARTTFAGGGAGEELPQFAVAAPVTIIDALIGLGFAASKNEARKLVAQGGARIDGEAAGSYAALVAPGQKVSAGKKRHGLVVSG